MSSSGGQQGSSQPGGADSGNQGTPSNSSPGASSNSNSAPGMSKGAIAGAVLGGLGGLLLLSLLIIWLLQRRKERQKGANAHRARPITYTGRNTVFRGLPFHRSSSQSPQASLLPQSQVFQSTNRVGYRVSLRGGEASQRGDENEMNNLPPSYAESQMSASMASLWRMNTRRTNSDAIVSPLSSGAPGTAYTISPQTTGATFLSLQRLWGANGPPTISPQTTGASEMVRPHTDVSQGTQMISPQTTEAIPRMPTPPSPLVAQHTRDTMGFPATPQPVEALIPRPLVPQDTRDTMGFPIEQEPEAIRLQPDTEPTIVSPVPRHPLIHQESLERVVREGVLPTQEVKRESPVLGDMHSVRIAPQAATNSDLARSNTQRTVSSVSSVGPAMVSDEELERLGVGSRGRYL